jgi:cell division protein FtsQ
VTATVTVRSKSRPSSSPRAKSHRRSGRGKKHRRSWRGKALAITAAVLVLILFGGSLWTIYFSSVFITKRVNVVGTHHLAPTQVSFAAQIPLGVPLARQKLDEIAKRATTLSAVESATATRDWPNTITVTVIERQPVLALDQPDGYAPNRYVIVDKFGVAYETQTSLPAHVVLGVVDPGDTPLLHDVATVAAALPDKLRGKVGRITATSPDDIGLILDSGRKVTWGSAADSELKAQAVMALLKRKPKSSIDVSSPHNPAIR